MDGRVQGAFLSGQALGSGRVSCHVCPLPAALPMLTGLVLTPQRGWQPARPQGTAQAAAMQAVFMVPAHSIPRAQVSAVFMLGVECLIAPVQPCEHGAVM